MDAMTLNVLLGIAIIVGIISIGLIVVGLRPQPKAESAPMWPPKFFFPLASDASLLTPRTTQTGSYSMPTLEMKFQPNADDDEEEPTARQLNLSKISELADKTKKPISTATPGGTSAINMDEITNKNVIDAKAATPRPKSDPDATNKQVLK